jgi:hypothetical protein
VARDPFPIVDVNEAGDEHPAAVLIQDRILSTVGSLASRLGRWPDELIRGDRL